MSRIELFCWVWGAIFTSASTILFIGGQRYVAYSNRISNRIRPSGTGANWGPFMAFGKWAMLIVGGAALITALVLRLSS